MVSLASLTAEDGKEELDTSRGCGTACSRDTSSLVSEDLFVVHHASASIPASSVQLHLQPPLLLSALFSRPSNSLPRWPEGCCCY